MARVKKKLLIAILVDPMACMSRTQEEEIEDHKRAFSELLGKRELEFYEPGYPAIGPDGLRSGTDIIVYDYGGMLYGCGDLLSSNARALFRWAQDNPRGAVLVVSSFTWAHQIKYELEDSGLDLPNVVDFHRMNEEDLPTQFRGLSVDEPAREALRAPVGFGQTFFRPTRKFISWLASRIGAGILVDAGCGQGQVGDLLRERGVDRVIGIDIMAPADPDTRRPFPIDATRFNYPRDATVLIARPCHDDWVERTIDRASRTAREILYVGLEKNVRTDLDVWYQYFQKIGVGAGKDEECVWSWKP